MDNIVSYAEFLVKSICKDPEMVKVSSYDLEDETLMLEVFVPDSEMGRVVGKNGKMASSLRTLILAYAYVHKLGKVKINIDSF